MILGAAQRHLLHWGQGAPLPQEAYKPLSPCECWFPPVPFTAGAELTASPAESKARDGLTQQDTWETPQTPQWGAIRLPMKARLYNISAWHRPKQAQAQLQLLPVPIQTHQLKQSRATYQLNMLQMAVCLGDRSVGGRHLTHMEEKKCFVINS